MIPIPYLAGRRRRALAMAMVLAAVAVYLPPPAVAQTVDPALMQEAARRSGRSPDELMQAYEASRGGAPADTSAGPGRQSLAGVDDRPRARSGQDPTGGQFGVVLPGTEVAEPAFALADSQAVAPADTVVPWFGEGFFDLDGDLFAPPSFGPVPEDYRLGVGDELVVDVWGDVEFRLTRIVDRDGAVILPTVGRIACAGRTVAEIDDDIDTRLARHHASVGGGDDDPEATTHVLISVGQLRPVRVFVVGEAARPGSYEVNSVSTVLTALYAAGGPSPAGSLRDVQLVRGGKAVARLDLYAYLLGGDRSGDARLREGDTIFLPARTLGVEVRGAVRRPLRFEMLPGETVADLFRYAGGFTPQAAAEVIRVRRILAPAERAAGQADIVILDVPFDAATMAPIAAGSGNLRDGDIVTVAAISDRVDRWVRIQGLVKRPGDYQLRPGLTVARLVQDAGGLWPDALTAWAVLDRTSPELEYSTLTVPLADLLAGTAPPVTLQARDVLRIFSRWDTLERPTVHISGEVHEPVTLDYRRGMTLRDLVLRAGGLKQSANLLHAEISRVRLEAVANPDTSRQPTQTVDVIRVVLGEDFLAGAESPAIEAWDRVAIRQLPWWETQRTVTLAGEVFYPGEYSLERKDETLSAVIARAGGLKPTAYAVGARVVRSQDGVGNIAVDLGQALAAPGSGQDIILEPGDRVIVPNRMYTVKVTGEVGFPTSLVYVEGENIDFYVKRAGGYLEHADKGRTRVVHPNGMSLPNKGGSKVVAGSTVIVPLRPPPEGQTKLEIAREITAIMAGLATVYLVIEATTR